MTQTSASNTPVLDEHTQPFFAEGWRTGKIEARFRLDGKGLENRIFVGRMAPVHGLWYPIIQEEVPSDERREAVSSFIVWAPLSCFSNTAASSGQIRRYWDKQLKGAPTPIKPGPDAPMRTLKVASLSRCHFNRESGLGCELSFSWQDSTRHSSCQLCGSGYLSDLRKGPRQRLDLPDMPWVKATSADDWLRAVVDMGEEFHHQTEKILHDPRERVAQAFRFFSLSKEERLCEALNCDEVKAGQAQELLLRALRFEMLCNSLLQGAPEVIWCWWADDPLIVGTSPLDVPPRLKEMREKIYAVLGLEPRYLGYDWHSASTMEEFLQEVAWGWVRQLRYRVEQLSAHDIALMLSEFNTLPGDDS